MVVLLLIAGIGFLLAGLVAIGFGIPINEFGFGNTLIVAGTVAACTGMLLIGFWMAVRELKNIARRLGSGAATEIYAEIPLQSGSENAGDAGPAASAAAPSSPPWHGEAVPRDRGQDDGAPAAADAAPAVKARRNLLFSSSSRKERERSQARTTDPSAADPHPEPTPRPPAPESAEPPPASFDDAWPKPERPRTVDVAPPRRSGRTPSTFAEPNPAAAVADRYPPAVRHEDPTQVTVLKSGVVDGMAYSLYSDGSIEAQMPEGMMRFASIDELRAHLDHRS
jgi:hypothetical protein